MANKKKITLLVLFFVGLVLGLHLQSSTVYANYLINEVTTQDIIDVCSLLSCPYNSTSAESRANALNRLLEDKNANLANVVFYTDFTNLYAILQNGSAGSDNLPILAVYYSSNNITVRAHQGFIYSGDKIIAVKPATYITKYMLSPSGGTYTESGGNIRFSGTLTTTGSTVDCNTSLLATWAYNAVATWQNTDYHGFRNLRPYKELSNWVTVVPTSTPTPTPTQAQSGSIDLTETNQKIDAVKNEVQIQGQSVVNTLSGNHEELMNTITDVPGSGDFQFFSSGDIDALTSDYNIVDPNESIWSHLIDGLHDSLVATDANLNITLFDTTYHIPPLTVNYPQPIPVYFATFCTVFVPLYLLKFWRRIVHIFQSGGALEVAHMFSNFDWSNFF